MLSKQAQICPYFHSAVLQAVLGSSATYFLQESTDLFIFILLSCRLFLDNLETILSKEAQKTAKEQDPAQVTHADKIEKKEGLLNWNRSAIELHNQVIPNLFSHNLFCSCTISFIREKNIAHRRRLGFV